MASSRQLSRELESARKKQFEAEKKVGELRSKESQKRQESEKAQEAAMKSSSPSTFKSKMAESGRRLKEAQDAGKQAVTWQKKATDAAKKVQDLQVKLTKAQTDEAMKAEKQRAKEYEKEMANIAAQQKQLQSQITATSTTLSEVQKRLPTPIQEKLRVLVLTSNPHGDLRLDREQKRIRQAVKAAVHRDWIEFDFRPAATPDDLLDGLTEFRPHMVHFSGHSNEEVVVMEEDLDMENDGRDITKAVLARALKSVDTPPSVILLNSCKSAHQLEVLVEQAIPFAVGMMGSIDDVDAVAFAARFYAAIANGQSLGSAVQVARVALEMSGLDGADLPILVHEETLDPTELYLVTSPDGKIVP